MLAQEEGRLLCVGEDSAEELIMRLRHPVPMATIVPSGETGIEESSKEKQER
jgi:hypothetical protein